LAYLAELLWTQARQAQWSALSFHPMNYRLELLHAPVSL
jgi:hypothetical protein